MNLGDAPYTSIEVKKYKYSVICKMYFFDTVVVKVFGMVDNVVMEFLFEVGQCLRTALHYLKTKNMHLFQEISFTIVTSNAFSIFVGAKRESHYTKLSLL